MAEDVSMEARVPVSKETLKTSFKVPTDQERKRPFLIGVAGGTCCGKSEVCKKILKDLGQANIESQMRKVIILSQESFYRDLDEEESAQADTGNFNFDHPEKKRHEPEDALVKHGSMSLFQLEEDYRVLLHCSL
eukprot:gene10573-19308_t